MGNLAALVLCAALCLAAQGVAAKSSGHHSGSGHHTSATHHTSSGHHATRSKAQRDAFMRTHPCPSTGKSHGACRGYVVDHVVPLKRGGPDRPENMQWQTTAVGKAKDKVE